MNTIRWDTRWRTGPRRCISPRGEYFDDTIALQYNRATWYSAETGRFVAQDTNLGMAFRAGVRLIAGSTELAGYLGEFAIEAYFRMQESGLHKLFKKELLSQFDARMRQHFPAFSLEKYDRNPMRDSRDRDYLWVPFPRLRIYIRLVPSHKGYDAFDCRIEWSKLDRFPEPRPAFYGRDTFHLDEGDVPLNLLHSHIGLGWDIVRKHVPPAQSLMEKYDKNRGLTPDEARLLISTLLDEVFDKLDRLARPFIAELVQYVEAERKAAGSGQAAAFEV